MSEPDQRDGSRPDDPSRGCCLNCGQRLVGDFCHGCGQRDLDLDRDLVPLLGSALSETFEADGRLPRSILPFFFSPGALVRAYLDGQRARFTSPVRIYVFSLFVAFFVFGWLAEQQMAAVPDTPLAEAPIDEEGARQVGPVSVRLDSESDEATDDADPPLGPVEAWLDDHAVSLEDLTQQELATMLIGGMLKWTPRLVTLMVPVFAAMLQVLYWRRRYLDHLVFSLDLHSRALLLNAGAAITGLAWIDDVVFWVVQIHLIVGLRVVYQASWPATLGRWMLLVVVYGVTIVLGLLAIVLSSLIRL